MIEVDGQKIPWIEGMTLAFLLQSLENVRFCSVVRLNGKLVSSPKFSETKIKENSKIELLPLVAGG
ncbi:MAG: thiamine biosynthesis protein ThiS [Desulfobacula sp. RIFOXYB2_FULL_45_6]|nr:MAG: thiamine biosynthesis protein ThiS [Desulfobacula sp. RIFOXYB2_FULL_45_6]